MKARIRRSLTCKFTDQRIYIFYIALGMTVAIMLLSQAIERLAFRCMASDRDSSRTEAAAEAAGIDALAWKLRAIASSGAIAGAIGAFYASWCSSSLRRTPSSACWFPRRR